MKFGVREIADVVFKAKSQMKIGDATFEAGQPVLYIDTATTSSMEQATTTVYAQGGRGNTRLIAWEGEKTVTFTVEDALLSPIGLSILTGAGLLKGASDSQDMVHIHTTANAITGSLSEGIDLTEVLREGESICPTAPIFVSYTESDGSITGKTIKKLKVKESGEGAGQILLPDDSGENYEVGKTVFVDFYITKLSANVSEIQISANSFGGNFYVEAATLFRQQSTGLDMPAELTFPNVKIQSNMTFNLSATGDPSTFTFTMDAMPGYTYFNKSKKVICAIQLIEDAKAGSDSEGSVFPHTDDEDIDKMNETTEDPEIFKDSVPKSI